VLRSLLALVYFILFYFGTEQNGTTPRRQRFLCHIKHKLFNFFPLTLRELGIYILGSIFFFFLGSCLCRLSEFSMATAAALRIRKLWNTSVRHCLRSYSNIWPSPLPSPAIIYFINFFIFIWLLLAFFRKGERDFCTRISLGFVRGVSNSWRIRLRASS